MVQPPRRLGRPNELAASAARRRSAGRGRSASDADAHRSANFVCAAPRSGWRAASLKWLRRVDPALHGDRRPAVTGDRHGGTQCSPRTSAADAAKRPDRRPNSSSSGVHEDPNLTLALSFSAIIAKQKPPKWPMFCGCLSASSTWPRVTPQGQVILGSPLTFAIVLRGVARWCLG